MYNELAFFHEMTSLSSVSISSFENKSKTYSSSTKILPPGIFSPFATTIVIPISFLNTLKKEVEEH